MNEDRDLIIETISRIMIPFIQLFSLYVIIHGSLGPGGGFQGGVIFASSFILFVIAFGINRGRERLPEGWNTALSSIGLYIYAGIGVLCIAGGEFLNYGVIPIPTAIAERRALMIDFVEIGIGMTVMAIITSIFFDIAWREEEC